MSTGYSWEGIRQVRATLLGARHVPERLCGGRVYLALYQVLDLYLLITGRIQQLAYSTNRIWHNAQNTLTTKNNKQICNKGMKCFN